jgi:hypothetical protein
MNETSYQAALGEALAVLKERSGRSYQWIGRRAFLSKSAVHRYCTGHALPQEFGAIERIARACRADRQDLDRLYALWSAAATAPGEAKDSGVAAVVPGPPAPAVRPRGWWRRPGPPRPRVAVLAPAAAFSALAVVATLAMVATLADPGGRVLDADRPAPPAGSAPAAQRISGPAWVLPPAPVPPTLFGVTLNSSTGAMPTFDVGAVRLWDSKTRWAQIQPVRGVFDWSILDGLIAGARRAGLPVLFVAGGTPGWAAPAGPRAPYDDGSRAAPPDDLGDWDVFVRTLVQRYKGRIEAYELWVLGNDRRFYSGSVETLVEMTRRASRIVRATDPAATVVCPGMGNLWDAEGRRVLRRFAEAGGYDHCDVAGIKLFQRSASDPPETMLQLLSVVDRTLHEAGAHPRLWSTGTTYSIPLQKPLAEATARQYAARFFLVGLYGRSASLERMYFYNWGGTKIPIVLQAEGGAPTAAARAAARVKRWLTGAQSHSCGHGAAIDVPPNVWRCELTLVRGGRRSDAAIWWTDTGSASVPAGRDVVVHRLDGGTTEVRSGAAIAVGAAPVLAVHPADGVPPASRSHG